MWLCLLWPCLGFQSWLSQCLCYWVCFWKYPQGYTHRSRYYREDQFRSRTSTCEDDAWTCVRVELCVVLIYSKGPYRAGTWSESTSLYLMRKESHKPVFKVEIFTCTFRSNNLRRLIMQLPTSKGIDNVHTWGRGLMTERLKICVFTRTV